MIAKEKFCLTCSFASLVNTSRNSPFTFPATILRVLIGWLWFCSHCTHILWDILNWYADVVRD